MPMYDYRCEQGCMVVMPDVLRSIAERDSCAPLCPDCHLPMVRFSSTSSNKRAAADDIPGGVWLENYGPNPIKVYSHTERKRLLKYDEHGMPRVDRVTGREYQLTEMCVHTGVPGTDKSPHTTDWSAGSIDAYTLEAARVLVSRPAEDKIHSYQSDRDREGIESRFRDERVSEFSEVATLTDFCEKHGINPGDL